MVATTTGKSPISLEPVAQPLSTVERLARTASPGFGQVFTEHMVSMRWTADQGWHEGRLIPYQTLPMDPAMVGLHYGQVVFEGLNAYRLHDGSVGIFRARDHARRFQRSAQRLVMPELPEELFVAAVEALVRQDQEWISDEAGTNLYLRPIMYATEAQLALRPAREYQLLVLAFLSAGYFAGGFTSVAVWISDRYIRAAPGGTGDIKCAGNYAGAMLAQVEAAEHGCQQVVWLDAVQRRWVEEMGGMNLFFVYGSGPEATLVTPPLTSTLLPGVTRASILELAPRLGFRTAQRQVSVDQWRAECADGTISEVFACGTAARVTPVGSVRSADGSWTVGDGKPGKVTTALSEALFNVQRGHWKDSHDWLHLI
jgi:branched-chain amino acid aminotransferase